MKRLRLASVLWSLLHGNNRARARSQGHALSALTPPPPPPNIRSAMKARRPVGLLLLLAVGVALSAVLLSHSPQPVQAQTPTVETHIWFATLTVGSQPPSFGYINDGFRGSFGADSFAASTFEVGGTGYRVRALATNASGELVLRIRSNTVQGSDPNLQLPAHNYILRVGDSEFTFHGTNDYDTGDGGRYRFQMAGLSLTAGQTIRVSLWGIGLPSVFGQLHADYDTDNDGLIEIRNLQQLDAVRYDLDGNGAWEATLADAQQTYNAAFPHRKPNSAGGAMMGCPSTGCRGYELTADLDFDTNGNGMADEDDTYWNGGEGWDPIGNQRSNFFNAEFSGNGHTISNLFINRPTESYVGLFSHTSGFLHHVGMKNVNVRADVFIGGLAGSVGSNSWTPVLHSGGGTDFGAVASAYATGRLEGRAQIGGLVGQLGGYLVASWTDVNISGTQYLGGVAGCVFKIRRVTLHGIFGEYRWHTVHSADGIVAASYALGRVWAREAHRAHPVSFNCRGYWNQARHNFFEEGQRITETVAGARSNSYFNNDIHRSTDAEGKTTYEMAFPIGYTGIFSAWNVDTNRVTGGDLPWDFGTARDYPKLRADRNGDGVFTVAEFPGQDQRPGGSTDYDTDDDNLIEVSSMVQLNAIRFDPDGDGFVSFQGAPEYPQAFPDAMFGMGCPDTCKGYELTADLDHDTNGNGRFDSEDWPYNAGQGFRPIGYDNDTPYSAEFHGNGHAIYNLNIHRSAKYTGLFGHISGQAYIHHVGLNDVTITSTSQDVGALVGFAQGNQLRISANYATGSVSGRNQTGGLVGSNQGFVRANWAEVTVNGGTNVGGLVGFDIGTVSAGYARGATVTGTSRVNGVVGRPASGTVHTYYDKTVNTVDHSFGRTTTELQAPTGYTGIYANWNSDLDGDMSADNPWDFGAADQYPVLKADRNGDDIYSWEEFGYQGRMDSRIISGLTVERTANELTSFDLSWQPVDPDVASTLYEVRYRIAGQPNWQRGPRNFTGVAATVSGLQERTVYEFQARVANVGVWSGSVYGVTGAQGAYITAILTIGPGRNNVPVGYEPGTGSLEPRSFTHDGTTYEITQVVRQNIHNIGAVISLSATLPVGSAIVRIGDLSFEIDVTGTAQEQHHLPEPNPNWVVGQKLAFVIMPPPPPLPVVSISQPTVAESGGQMTFRVSLNTASAEEVTVDYAVDAQASTAVAGVDYQTLQAGTVTFAPGDTRRTVSLTVIDDDVGEALHETVVLKLTNPVNAAFPDDALSLSSTGRITDNDGANADQNSPPRITSVYFNEGALVGPKSSVTNTLSGTRFTVGYRVYDRDDPKWDRNKNGIHDEDGLPVQKDAGLDRKCLKWSGGLEPLDPTGYGQLGACLYIGHNTAWLVAPHVTPLQVFSGENCMEFTAIAVDKKGARTERTESLCVTHVPPTIVIHGGVNNERRDQHERYPNFMVEEGASHTRVTAGGSYAGFISHFGGFDYYYTIPITSWEWEQVEGPSVLNLLGTDTHSIGFVPPQVDGEEVLRFSLTVTDSKNMVSERDVYFTVVDDYSRPDVFGSTHGVRWRYSDWKKLRAQGGETVRLSSGLVRMNSPVQLHWEQVFGGEVQLSSTTVPDPTFVMPDNSPPGTEYAFLVTATAQNGEREADMVTVVKDDTTGPTACAGPDLTGAPDEEVTLQGRCSTNPHGPWHRMAHQWTQLSGPTVTLSDATRGDPSFTLPADAADGTTLEFQLTVTDREGQTDTDSVVVTVDSTPEATPPTACAGPDLEAQPGDTVTLEGTCSTNPHGQWWRMAHLWTQPEDQNIVLSDATIAKPSFTVPSDAAPGAVYTFTLTVTDKDGESDSDDMTVTVPGAEVENRAPSFDESGPATREVAENSGAGVSVGAAVAATDPDGDTLSYSLSGTDAASFGIDAETGQLLTIEGVAYDHEAQASYSVTVEAADGNGGTASIAVTITLSDVHEATPVTDCFTDMGALSAAAEYAGAWDDDECRAHHQDSQGRYFHFTLSEETVVTIKLTPESDGALYVSRDTPRNGWGTEPNATYEDRRRIRRDNGKLAHDGPHVSTAENDGNTVTLTLAAGVTYTVEAAGTADGGTFTLNIVPQ